MIDDIYEQGDEIGIDIFEETSNRSSREAAQKKRKRFEEIENLRDQNALRKQIDYLYDREFINLNPNLKKKR